MKSNPFSRSLCLLTCIGILATMIFTGCINSANQATPDPIQNIIWQWESVTDQSTGTKTVVPDPEKYTLAFYSDGKLSGKADCNMFEGTYSQQNGFTITLGASTMAFCGETSLDQQYLGLLGSVAAGGPDGAGGFALETAGGEQRMLFKNGGPAPKT